MNLEENEVACGVGPWELQREAAEVHGLSVSDCGAAVVFRTIKLEYQYCNNTWVISRNNGEGVEIDKASFRKFLENYYKDNFQKRTRQ